MGYPDNTDSVAQDQLIDFVRRIESVEDQTNALNSDKSEIYKDAKGQGFDLKVLRKVIADRRKDAGERAEFETVYELYWNAVHGVVRAHVETIEEIPPSRPEGVADATRSLGEVRTPSAGTEGDEDRQPIQVPAQDGEGPHKDKPDAAPLASVDADANADAPQVEADNNGVTGGESAAAPRKQWKFTDTPHIDCLNPEQCGGLSNLGLCQKCKQASGVAL